MQLFNKIASGLKTRAIHTVPGENDGTLDGGMIYREHSARATTRSITRASISFALDNVSQGRPELARPNGVAQRGPRAVSPRPRR
jgi:hypothetical protein